MSLAVTEPPGELIRRMTALTRLSSRTAASFSTASETECSPDPKSDGEWAFIRTPEISMMAIRSLTNPGHR